MRKLLLVLSCALFSVSAFAGVTRFAAKRVARPAAKESVKVLRFSAKKALAGSVKAAKVAAHVAY